MTAGLFSAIMALGPEPQKIVRQDLDSILGFTDLVGRMAVLDLAVWVDGSGGFHYPDRPKINHRTQKLLWQDNDGLGSLVLDLFDTVTSVQYELNRKRIDRGTIEALAASGEVTTALQSLISDIDRSTAVVPPSATSASGGLMRENSAPLPESPHPTGITPEKRTRPMSKSEVARILGRRGNKKRFAEWTTDCINRGVLRYEEINRQSGFYHIDDFPGREDEVRPK